MSTAREYFTEDYIARELASRVETSSACGGSGDRAIIEQRLREEVARRIQEEETGELPWWETGSECQEFLPLLGYESVRIPTPGQRLAAAVAAALDEGAVQGFADCEALVVAMLGAMAGKEAEKALKRAPQGIEREGHEVRAGCLREAALAVQLGQHRTDAYDPEELATAHRRAAQPSLAAKGGKARALALSPERRREIAQKASDAALTARRLRAKGE